MMGHVPNFVVVTFCVGYVTAYGRVWFLHAYKNPQDNIGMKAISPVMKDDL